MTITKRPYKLLSDFNAVHKYLIDIYTLKELNSMMLPQFFEYAHIHPAFNHKLTHRFTLWEKSNKIVALTCYEMDIGEAFLVAENGYDKLLPEMLCQAEKELSVMSDDKHTLSVWVIDTQSEHIRLLGKNGYSKVHTEPVRIFEYSNGFIDTKLPDGFSCITLVDENDFEKIHACMWKGFNHSGEPDGDIDCRRLMQSGPHFSHKLSTVIKAPNGDYACYAGMWFDRQNKYAYLEPLCTVPEYRHMGLATCALTETMKRTKVLGATYCFGGVPEFYTAIGFKTICYREMWKKEW